MASLFFVFTFYFYILLLPLPSLPFPFYFFVRCSCRLQLLLVSASTNSVFFLPPSAFNRPSIQHPSSSSRLVPLVVCSFMFMFMFMFHEFEFECWCWCWALARQGQGENLFESPKQWFRTNHDAPSFMLHASSSSFFHHEDG